MYSIDRSDACVGIANKKFITTAEFKRMGYSYYKIGKLEKDGILSRINRSIYENLTYKGEENDFFSAEAYVSNGVICLISAAILRAYKFCAGSCT